MPALSGARREALGRTAPREQVILLMCFRGTVRADRIELGVRNLHFFDPGSGLTIGGEQAAPKTRGADDDRDAVAAADSMGMLTDMVALVTGGTRGIGTTIGRELALFSIKVRCAG